MTQLVDFQVEPKDIIKQIIVRRNISVRTLSNQIDTAEQNVSKMLSGSRTLTDTTLAKMAKALGIAFEMAKYGEGLEEYLKQISSQGNDESISMKNRQKGDQNESNLNYKNTYTSGPEQDDARQRLREAELKILALERENELLKEINNLLKSKQ